MLVSALVTSDLQDGRIISEYRRDKSPYAEKRNEFQTISLTFKAQW